ncbi:DUF4123 domain-containing protein [Paraburkholderia tropica]|uniref:DUF4123 domain-containing protein n=1 Tax=Paraburkholderia tropica TaxID=92647 RepID=UPI002AB108CB|nr:DUF4123 domain-containing protein [Paraburkholderia tropica]
MLQKIENMVPAKEEGLQSYLLLETGIIEDYLRVQANAVDSPSILTAVKQIDFATLTGWVWAETEYASHAQRGPLLVQMEEDSPLPAAFRDGWAPSDGGVFITSRASIDKVLAQLRSILFVYLPDGDRARFRLQETAALSSVLRALAPLRVAQLLGPISQLLWLEDIAPTQYQWWSITQQQVGDIARAPFQFTHAEMSAIDHYLAEHRLSRQVALTRMARHSHQGDPHQQTVEWMTQLQQWGFQRHSDVSAGLDIFRHAGFSTNAPAITQALSSIDLTPGARITQAANLLNA